MQINQQVQELASPAMLSGIRTYLMGGGVIIHQILKAFGLDLSDEVYSAFVDVALGLGVIYFRFRSGTKMVVPVVPVEVVQQQQTAEPSKKEDSNVR